MLFLFLLCSIYLVVVTFCYPFYLHVVCLMNVVFILVVGFFFFFFFFRFPIFHLCRFCCQYQFCRSRVDNCHLAVYMSTRLKSWLRFHIQVANYRDFKGRIDCSNLLLHTNFDLHAFGCIRHCGSVNQTNCRCGYKNLIFFVVMYVLCGLMY